MSKNSTVFSPLCPHPIAPQTPTVSPLPSFPVPSPMQTARPSPCEHLRPDTSPFDRTKRNKHRLLVVPPQPAESQQKMAESSPHDSPSTHPSPPIPPPAVPRPPPHCATSAKYPAPRGNP